MNTRNAYHLPDDFKEFASMPKFETDIDYLVSVAEPEDWNYKNTPTNLKFPILHNYINNTYRRIAEEKKVAVTQDEESACWNTGLITPNQEPIYILFNKNKLPTESYWSFWKFARRGERDLTRFVILPEMAHYFDDPSTLIYDTRKELRVDIEHIVADNRKRFPTNLQSMSDHALKNMLHGAVESARERVKRNYKTAVPQYYRGAIQLLLPLNLTDPAKVDLALAVERFSNFYRAATCLTPDMAYNNARPLARPDREWLQP